MTKKEVRNLFAGFRAILRVDFWKALPQNFETGIQLLGAVIVVFFLEVVEIVLTPEDIRNQK